MNTFKITAKILVLAMFSLFISCSDDPEEEQVMSAEITSDITGFYSGIVRADVGEMLVSIVVRPNGTNRFRGKYYGTEDFSPCCNDDDREDGTFGFLVDGNDIVEMDMFLDLEFSECTATYDGDGIITVMNDRNVFELDLVQQGCFFDDLQTTWTLTKVRNLE